MVGLIRPTSDAGVIRATPAFKAGYDPGSEITMHPAANVQFERAVDELVRWRAVPEDERSPAPAWWWGPAFEVLAVRQPMPATWCAGLDLPDSATYADGAKIFLECLADQTSLTWPGDFPRNPKHSDPA